MFDEEQICPYTGLRSFTEEESLYFKGREEDIDQATEQLQRNKFLMLTGASGDGKSSLIYAGIIPNARAGFLKSKYTNWCVADFRPERTPFQNLCKSVGRQLDISNINTVRSELNHGFSAIVDLYKNSNKFLDTNSAAWQQADDTKKATLKREAANLIILVDQFEEFFTNPENYNKGVPSREANLVLNLLLETARIAYEEDLPIYVVFTMRSDYIGQCAAFRGLPEYIGFSQFFVPRLNRTQLQQVVEEPAVLSGNRISRRLTERLIHDLTEGVDQLPIMQHALNQIWHAADNGKEEMDLIHYAMVGGMPVNELPDEQVERFNTWFDGLPADIKSCYHEPNLQNVLDTHTNKLYEQANEYFVEKTGKLIIEEDAKAIIRTAFICLTKIDQSRAVRNRMTLKEITNIFGRPEFGSKEIGVVLNIFREPGNTFIRPFILDDEKSKELNEDDILDITHESLIRNWRYLGQWAEEEFDNYTISLDFEQQLNRWVDSGKSKDFLLSIGPLTYFENWFKSTKPNAHWIARYLPEDTDRNTKLSNATEILSNAEEFLSRSAKKHVVTRTVMRYGAKRIFATLGLIAVLLFSSFAVRDFFQKKNSYVLSSIKAQSLEIVNEAKLSPEFPIPVITEQLIAENISIPEVIDAIKDENQKVKVSTGIATQLVMQGRYEPREQILQSLSITDSLLEQFTIPETSKEISEKLKLIHDFSVTAGFACLVNQDEKLKAIVQNNAKRSANWALTILRKQPDDFSDFQNLNLLLEEAINNKELTQEEINELLGMLSPFENNNRTKWVNDNYQQNKVLVRGGLNYGLPFNSLYQDLAYLYAAAGQPEKVLQCMDTILYYQDNFFQKDYSTHAENASHIAAVFYIYGTTDHLDQFVNGFCSKKNSNTVDFYNSLVSWALMNIGTTANMNFYSAGGGQEFSNLNLKFSSDAMMTFFFSKLKEENLKNNNGDEKNFLQALFLKNEGVFFAYRNDIRGITDTLNNKLFREAILYYQLVSDNYLNQSVSIVNVSASDLITVPQKFLFLYPDYRVPFHPFEPRSILQFYQSAAFINYIIQNDLFDRLYKTPEDFYVFQPWLLDYQVVMVSHDFFFHDNIPFEKLEQLATKLEKRNANKTADLTILYLQLSDQAFDQNKTEKGIEYIKRIQLNKLLNAFQYKNFGWVNSYSLELVAKALANLSINDQFELGYSLLRVFNKEVNRSSIYGYASQIVSLQNGNADIARRLIDSAKAEMIRIDNPAAFQPNRHQVAMALMYLDPDKNSKEAYQNIKNSFAKFAAITRFSKAFAIEGNLYKAQEQMPNLISAADRASFIRLIMEGYNSSKPEKNEWKKFNDNKIFAVRRFLPYINENQ